jgi:peptidyl-prolyl cis-trans isomerase A (cyclophilin A)
MRIAVATLTLLALAACGGGSANNAGADNSSNAAVEASAAPAASVAAAAPNPADTYKVDFETSRGPFVVAVTRSLAPNGADRFYKLIQAKYFDGARFYRVVPHFVVQFGGAADPKVSKAWDTTIPDDPVKASNVRGALTFAASSQPDSRTTHVFINLADNQRLDAMGFAPIGQVVSGMTTVDKIYSGDGEKPDQGQIASDGNAYLEKEFPHLDYIKTARIVK